MVTQDFIKYSNSLIPTALPPNLVAVFVGGTSGIGEYTARKFAQYAKAPRLYIVGRSQEAADRIMRDMKAMNSKGQYVFLKADTSLIKNVDEVCEEIRRREAHINILCLSTGGMAIGVDTSEKLHVFTALNIYSRMRFILNLLPLLQAAPSIRRVISVGCGTKEGEIDLNDLQLRNTGLTKLRPHAASMITLLLEELAKQAPEVSFIHDYPGSVKSGLMREAKGASMLLMKAALTIVGPFMYIPNEECGRSHLFLATSARYPAKVVVGDASGTPLTESPLGEGVTIARGTDGKEGSGVYSIDEHCESAKPEVEELLARLRKDGVADKLWSHLQEEFARIASEQKSSPVHEEK
jgi:NAD(P)-dependent dehydrogenase (short-subunit alcohol dehydrogenase family)